MEHFQEYLGAAKAVFPIAALYLGSLDEARSAVIEAVAAALRKSPAEWQTEVLPQLLRICRIRAPERIESHDFPETEAVLPILPVLKLPVNSRFSLALTLCGITPEEIAAARDISPENAAHQSEKALRQLRFLQSGEPADPEQLAAAAKALPWRDADTEALRQGLQDAADAADAAVQPAAPVIRRSDNAKARTVTVPLWSILLAVLAVIGILAVMLYQFAASRRPRTLTAPVSVTLREPAESVFAKQYLPIGDLQKRAADEAGLSESDAVFLSTKLDPDTDPAVCQIQLSDGKLLHLCTLAHIAVLLLSLQPF